MTQERSRVRQVVDAALQLAGADRQLLEDEVQVVRLPASSRRAFGNRETVQLFYF